MNMLAIASGCLKLDNDRWPNLRRVLEAIMPHWITETQLGGKGIQFFLLKDSKVAVSEPKKSLPIIILRALREVGYEPKPMIGYELVEDLRSGIPLDILINRLQCIFDDAPLMDRLWEEEKFRTNPAGKLGQGDGYFKAYKVDFSTYYYDTFVGLYLSYNYTPA